MNDEANPLILQAIQQELRSMNVWLRILAEPVLRERLTAALKDETDRAVYQASTGVSVREVEQATGVSKSKVANAWNRWASVGLMEATDVPGRYRRLASLDEIGFKLR